MATSFFRHRTALALVQLLFLYAALCYVLLEIGFASRNLIEAAPFLPRSSSAFAKTAYPAQLAGMNVSLQQYTDASQRQAALERLAAAGFGWVRQRADWNLLEPSPGRYAWAQMDDILADVAAAGLEIVIVLDGSPAWARSPLDRPPADNPFAPPAAPDDFARFAAAFALRYGESVRFYQIWDEPNIAPHWGNRLTEPIAYGRLLAQVVPAIRAADADAVILLAALAPTADRGHTAIDEAYYLQRLYATGAAPYFDAVAVQPYGFGLAPDDPRSRVAILNFQRVGLLRRVMVAAGDGAKPVWAVRYGWNRSTNGVWQTVTPDAQARYVEQANALARGWPWLAGLGWAVDRPAAPTNDPLWGFALYTPDGLPVALWDRFALVNRSSALLTGDGWLSLLSRLFFWLSALLGILWRGWRTGGAAQIGRWPARFAQLPLWTKTAAWVLLVAVYYFATWPPLIGLCWLIAALFLAAEPLVGLVLVGLLLPFHSQHKELQLVGTLLAVPPVYAVLLCSLPRLLRQRLSVTNSVGALLAAPVLRTGRSKQRP
ncbi:MAG: cellulase family glycosylhydrolase, partial [Chloroflexi bacterium]|nr:cellulase family glycosylhydrolase [Chloroflexota bacterium]